MFLLIVGASEFWQRHFNDQLQDAPERTVLAYFLRPFCMLYESAHVQRDCELACHEQLIDSVLDTLNTKKHASFLLRGTKVLSEGFVSLDAARPWLFYWCLNGLNILKCLENDAPDKIKW